MPVQTPPHEIDSLPTQTLRSVFITWLRDSTDAPQILKSAAHAMKHSEQRQGSGRARMHAASATPPSPPHPSPARARISPFFPASSDYDQEADDRLVKAAYDFNLSFANSPQFAAAPVPGEGGASSSAAAPPPEPRPSRPGKEVGMAKARAMANGKAAAAVAAAPTPPPPPPVPSAPSAPSAADPPVPARRCNFAACTIDPPTHALRDCAACGAPHHHACSIKAGCEEDASLCAACLDQPVFDVVGPIPDADANVAAMEHEGDANGLAEEGDALVDDGWRVVPGGPFLARLMKPSRQPPAQAEWRRFYVSLPFNPIDTPLTPGGYIHFPVVAGAPSHGVTCKLPPSWTNSDRSLVFTLKLSKVGATERTVTIQSAVCRDDEPPTSEEEPTVEAEPVGADQQTVPERAVPVQAVPELPAGTFAVHPEAIGEAAALALLANEPPLERSHSPSPTVPSPPPPSVTWAPLRPSRTIKRKERFGDNGELEGAASSFRSAPALRKASVDPSEEWGVPAFASPGSDVYAIGLFAGVRKRFRAKVVKLRSQFPRIVVEYTATADGQTGRHTLPEMKTAYLMMTDVFPRDW